MDEAGIQPAQNASVAQTGFVVHAKIEKLFTCGSAFRQPWFLIPLFALAGCFLTLCSRFSLDLFAKWACRRSCFLQHALSCLFGRSDHNLSGNYSFRTFLLPIFDINCPKVKKQGPFSPCFSCFLLLKYATSTPVPNRLRKRHRI